MNQFPPSPWVYHYTLGQFWVVQRAVAIGKNRNFNYFIWTPLGRRVNIYINFCLQVHSKVSAAWYCSHYLPPVSTTTVANLPPVLLIPVAICHRCQQHKRKFCAGVVDTGGKFAASVLDTGGNFASGRKFASGVVDTGGAPCLANISENYRINSKWRQCYFQALLGRWFMKKTWSKKPRDTVPLSRAL